jgi:ligand-binding sensor domain-containing protein/nitrogen-specific signal transduction histidine kinase
VQDREGNLWFATERGVTRYDGAQFTTFTLEDGLPERLVRSIIEDRAGDLWFGTFGGGACRYNGTEFTSFSAEDGLADNNVHSILQDRAGHMWFTSGWLEYRGKGVSRYDGAEFITFTAADGLVDNTVHTIVEDSRGDLWFGTEVGVSRYDGTEFVGFTTEDGLVDNRVKCIYEDSRGDLWFGTGGMGFTGGGVSRYDGKQFSSFTADNGTQDTMVRNIMEDRAGQLWFSAWLQGVLCYDGEETVRFTVEDGLADNKVHVVREDWAGHLWLGTHGGGVSRYDGAQFKTFGTRDGLGHNHLWSVYQSARDSLWFGTFEGVSRYDGKRFTTFNVEDGLAHNIVRPILQDRQGHLWFGTFGGGVSRYDGEEFVNFTVEDGLADSHVQAMLEDGEGNLWFGTRSGGVSRYDGEEFVHFTSADGLADNHLRSIWEDDCGHLWFGTFGGGVSRYDGQVFQTLSRKDGLVHNAINQVFQDHRGDFWIATEGGLSRYRSQRTLPAISLEVIADHRYSADQEIKLPLSQEFAIFEFQGKSLTTRPDSMAYVYRLEGFEVDWQTTYARRVEYQDLPLGEYAFQIRAVDRDLNYSDPVEVQLAVVPDPRDEQIDELEVRVRERTQELADLNMQLAAEIDERERTEKQLIRLERLRALGEMSAGVSHNLNNILVGVLGFAELIRLNNQDPQIAEDIEQVIASGLRAKDLVRRLHRAVHPGEEGALLPVAINEVVREVVQSTMPRWKDEPEARGILIDVKTRLEMVPPIQGTQSGLYDLLVNLLLNAVDAMPEGGGITFSSEPLEDGVQLLVQDSGIGMDEETRRRVFEPFFTTKMDVGTGLGLAGVYGTMVRWEGRIEVESTPGEGTLFILWFPVWREPEFPHRTLAMKIQPASRGKVLIVEDDEVVCDLLTRVLSEVHEVEAFLSGAEALDRFAPGRYDVILVDLGLPGLPGDQLMRQMKQVDPSVAAVLVTGWGLRADDPALSGFDFWLQKPFEDMEKIRDIVDKAVKLQRQ